jgi:hypothetical protein
MDPSLEACARCGYTRQNHALVNYMDGLNIGIAVLVCPFATWKEPGSLAAVGQRVDDPHLSTRAKS